MFIYFCLVFLFLIISEDLISQGVNCVKDNSAACEFADVLLLCILPAQLPQLAKEIKHIIRPDCIVYSIVAGTPISKLSFLLGTTNVLTPNLSWNEKNNASKSWNCRENILAVMKTKNITDKILPQENSGMDGSSCCLKLFRNKWQNFWDLNCHQRL